MKLAVCLAGGGVKGAAHIGVLKALEEENIKYEYICGTSSGSIVAALNAMGYNPNEIYNIFKNYCSKVKKFDMSNFIKLVGGVIFKKDFIIDGLKSGEVIEDIVNKAASRRGIYNINQISKNLLIPAVDLNRGTLYMFSSINKRGKYRDEIEYIDNISIGKAVRGSCSYPGVFSPCKYMGKQLIDGGIRENLPWKEAKRNGADKVFCVNFQNEKTVKKNKNIIDVISGAIDILRHELSNYEIIGADYLLTLKTKDISLLDCSKIDYLYKLGYEETQKFIKANLGKF